MKPTLRNISDPGKALKWTVFHVLLGVLSMAGPWAFIIYFFIVLKLNLGPAIRDFKRGDVSAVILLVSYVFSFELLARMTRTSPFIPVEYTKYLMVLFGVYLLSVSPRKSNATGLTMIALIIPSVFFDLSGERIWADIVNNYLGTLGLAIFVSVLASFRPPAMLVGNMMRLLWLPLVSIVVCMFVKTPELDESSFEIVASTVSTGGASSNQAATMLGFGMFLTFYSIYYNRSFSGKKLFDVGFLMLFAVQGLLSLSRGGMVVGVIAILMTLAFQESRKMDRGRSSKKRGFPIVYAVFGILLLGLSYMIVDEITGNKLTLRFKGETEGTAGGYAEKDMKKITSGRSMIVEGDLKIWSRNPVFGGGAGSSHYLRSYDFEGGFIVAPHVELSRLLAEQGLFGLFFFCLIIYIGVRTFKTMSRWHEGNVLFILFTIALLTSLHSAMRTFVTPFLVSVCAMTLAKAPTRTRR